jgi:hypothetical protein
MMSEAKSSVAPDFLKDLAPHYLPKNLTRVGRDCDGGYLLPRDVLTVSSIFCLTLGVGCDVSFETSLMKKIPNSKFELYDGSMKLKPIFLWAVNYFPKIHRSLSLLYKYCVFTYIMKKNSKNFKLCRRFVGDRTQNPSAIDLSEILTNHVTDREHHDMSIIKIDIERSEYEIFSEEAFEEIKYYSVVIIEFHGALKFSEEIQDIMKNFHCQGFFVGHFHNNNSTPFMPKIGCNNCFELTLLNSKTFTQLEDASREVYPLLTLDHSSDKTKEEHEFQF